MTVTQANVSATKEVPARVTRHLLIDRVYHWLMAACVLTLLATAFLPIIGYKFEWLGLHWTTGVALSALVLIHVVRAVIWQDFWAMVIDGADLRDAWRHLSQALGGKSTTPGKPGKYSVLQKLYHAGIAILVLSIVVTGLLMLIKIDTPLWRRNPYVLADYQWGWIYVVHGFAAMALITMVMIHVYFALRPDEWRLTRSMLRGWISRREFEEHHDKARWAADGRHSHREVR
jgi:cytochrome b subunit of formate dehydrogenase